MRFIVKPIAWALVACLVNNPIYGFYLATGLIFFKPLPAFAEAFLDSAVEGQALGTELMNDYSIPNVDSVTGKATFTNGLVAGQTIDQNELFQEITPGSMDDITASYGDGGAFGGHVSSNLGSLTTGTSTHAYAYQTLMGANTSMPNMKNDPIWKTSDDIYSLKSPLIKDLFNGCEKKTNWAEKECSIHIADLKTCKKNLKTEACKVKRGVKLSAKPTMSFIDGSITFDGVPKDPSFAGNYVDTTDVVKTITLGNGYVYDTSTGCHQTLYTMNIYVEDGKFIQSATLKRIIADGDVTVKIDDSLIHSIGGGGCPDWYDSDTALDIDATSYFTTGDHAITASVGQTDDSSAHAIVQFEVIIKPLVEDSFEDFPAGCRQRMFDNWPPAGDAPVFVSSGSLNDEASTTWWKCTEASNDKIMSGVTITPDPYGKYLGPILPAPPASPPAPICYAAETRMPGRVTLPCFLDKDGYEVCPDFDYITSEHSACDELAANPDCAYVGEKCADGAEDHVTGICPEFIITYDCGTNHPSMCGQVNVGEKTICDSPIRCMGGECIDQETESNKDFIKAATGLQVLNQAQQSNGCDAGSGDCKLFQGVARECQMADVGILGEVDCCNMPMEASWIDYMELAANTWELADSSVEMYSIVSYGADITNLAGAWTLVTDNTVLLSPLGSIADSWTAVTETFSSAADSVASMLGETVSNALSSVSLEAIKATATQWMGEWIAEIFGETVASTLLTTTTTTTAGVTTATYSMAGSLLSSIVTAVGIIYALYQIAKLVVTLVFACTKDEIELNMLKQQKLCTDPTEIGTYCSSTLLGSCVARKESYCCFASPFAKIFQQQARPQLKKGFGDPKAPTCEGIPISDIKKLDFNKMDFSEWINMLKVSNQIPTNSAAADEMWDKANVTKGKLPNASKNNAQDRLDGQTKGSDIDTIRQHLLDNL